MPSLREQIRGLVRPSSPIFVHSDLHEGFRLLRRAGFAENPDGIASSMVQFLSAICETDSSELIFPAFNYDFGTSRVFDVDNDPIQVGALPEALRVSGGYQRTHVPFFSSLHAGEAPQCLGNQINPWGEGSVFGLLAQQRGSILFCGAGIDSFTFIHHIEASVPGGPVYRYDKVFLGEIRAGDETRMCSLTMHVRPLGIPLHYDWPKIEAFLRDSGSLRQVAGRPEIRVISAYSAKVELLRALSQDPYFLLHGETIERLAAVTHQKSERLKIDDFE